MNRALTIIWRLLFVLLAISYADTTSIIANGGFNHIGLTPEMIGQEKVGNAMQSIGWCVVLILSFRDHPLFAPELCLFLAGMLFFDVQTTWTLEMPLPPGFLYWGTLVVALKVLAARTLASQRRASNDRE